MKSFYDLKSHLKLDCYDFINSQISSQIIINKKISLLFHKFKDMIMKGENDKIKLLIDKLNTKNKARITNLYIYGFEAMVQSINMPDFRNLHKININLSNISINVDIFPLFQIFKKFIKLEEIELNLTGNKFKWENHSFLDLEIPLKTVTVNWNSCMRGPTNILTQLSHIKMLHLENLIINLMNSNCFMSMIIEVLRSTNSVKFSHLSINLSNKRKTNKSHFESEMIIQQSIEKPIENQLNKLNLNFKQLNIRFSVFFNLIRLFRNMKNLTDLEIDFTFYDYTISSYEFDIPVIFLDKFINLNRLSLNFNHRVMGDKFAFEIFNSIKNLKNLKNLSLYFKNNRIVGNFFKSIDFSCMKNLENLTLDLSLNFLNINSFSIFLNKINRGLKFFSLNLRRNKIENNGSFSIVGLLSKFNLLQIIDLNFSGNNLSNSLQLMTLLLNQQKNLSEIIMDSSYNNAIEENENYFEFFKNYKNEFLKFKLNLRKTPNESIKSYFLSLAIKDKVVLF